MLRCSCCQKVRGLGLCSHHVCNLRTRHGRLIRVKGRTKVPLLCQLCSCPRPQPTLGYINTHPRMHLCSNVRVHAQVARAHTPNNCAPCCEPSWLNSFRKFCQFGLSKCCCRKHERGITSCLAVNVTELYTNTRTHTHIGMQQHSKAHTQLWERDDTLLNPCGGVLSLSIMYSLHCSSSYSVDQCTG